MFTILILLITGVIAGIMSGMFGIGGGAIIVPMLMLFLGFSQTAANGSSLAALMLPVGFFGVMEYYRSGKLEVRAALLLAAGIAFASWFGANIALAVPKEALKLGYALFLLYYAWRSIAPRLWYREWQGLGEVVVEEKTKADTKSPRSLIICFFIGLLAGVASGLFGIGGGLIIVPFLLNVLNYDQKLATGTSLGALLLPVGIPAVFAYAQANGGAVLPPPEFSPAWLPQIGDVALWAAAPLALLLLAGAFFGARITLSLPAKTVRRLYGFFLLFIAARFFWDSIPK
jgi:uncharacterized membrane protein YfcA